MFLWNRFTNKKKNCFSISCGKALSEDFAKFSELVDGIRNLEDIYVRDEQTRKKCKRVNRKRNRNGMRPYTYDRCKRV